MPDKETMIEALVSLVDDWDLDTLIDYAKTQVYADLDNCTLDEVAKEYTETFPEKKG